MPWRRGKFGLALMSIQLALTILNIFFVKYAPDADASDPKHSFKKVFGGSDPEDNEIEKFYPMFQDVNVMIFLGFGFLMTFLRRYGFGAVGFTMIVTVLSVQTSILIRGLYEHDADGYIPLGIKGLLSGLFSSAVVLISFGALIGKVTPLQLIVMTVIEVVVSASNEFLGVNIFKAADVGGSIFLHTFGAYFGLSVAFVLYTKKIKESTKEESSYTSDIFAMIGTVFLWMYWPSFNSIPVTGDARHRAVVNTYLSLIGSCVATFFISSTTNSQDKFSMVHIQNATLAGGVAMGATADMMVNPYGALIIGLGAGCISTLGYRYLQPALLKLRLHDTCGVNNLHGMPGLLAGLISIVIAGVATESTYQNSLYDRYPARAPQHNSSHFKEILAFKTDLQPGYGWTAGDQALHQLIALAVTFGIALASGALTGLFLLLPIFDHVPGDYLFEDEHSWDIEEEMAVLPIESKQVNNGSISSKVSPQEDIAPVKF